MKKTAILCDSCSDIPAELLEKYDIHVVNFHIALDGETYIENESFTRDEFYDLMRKANGVPTTSAINPVEFCTKFCEFADAGYDTVIYAAINKSGSATYNNALLAQKMLDEERPNHGMKIHILDSHTYSMAFGWYLCEIARKIRNGAEAHATIEEFNEKMTQMEILLGPFSLKQMKKSGRISAAAAFAGELLGLRPIISMVDGETVVENKVRGDAKVIPALLAQCKKKSEGVENFEYMIGYTDGTIVNELVLAAKKEFGKEPLIVFKLGCVVSTNTGPDVVALAFTGKKR